MRLKKLVLHGFKSFADRTTFTFEDRGVSSIVGPNGCGKSNVIDAVKWVLGEQRPTSLRGREMMDVIFNGTVRRPPMGLCEGTLVFDNTGGTLPTDEHEVAVTRRVFRTGETEYLVNGRPVRLKDVRDLFAGTGLGYGGYGFMEQGKIDSILASNPVDRRRVFEEAAGISRFRARRRETELKLKHVEDNLARLNDIVDEVSRQIRSLKIHAGKARSHREMTARIRDLQLALNMHRYKEIRRERNVLEAEQGRLAGERDEAARIQQELREEVRGIEAELQERMEAVGAARTRQAELSGRIDTLKEKVGLHGGYRQELAERLANREAEIRLLQDKLVKLKEDQVLARREGEESRRDAARAAEVEEQHRKAVEEQESRRQELQERVSEAERLLKEAESALAATNREQAGLEAHATNLDERLAGLTRRRERLEEERAGLKRTLQERTGRQEDQTSALESRRRELTEAELRADELEQAYLEASDRLGEARAEQDRVQGRIGILAGVLDRREGLDQGVRAVLEQHQQDPAFLPGLRGLLADHLEVDLEQAPAVARALGPLASALVVRTCEEALAGLRFLEEQGAGGAAFLPLELFPETGGGALQEGLQAGSRDLQPVLDTLLGEVEVVDPEELRQRLRSRTGLGSLLVGRDGVVVRDGRVVELPPGGEAGHDLVVLQAERRDLERRLQPVRRAVEEAAARVEDARRERDRGRARVKELSVAVLEEEGEAARLDQEIVRHVQDVERLDREAEELHQETLEVRQALQELDGRRSGLAEAARRHELGCSRAEEELQRRRAALEEQTQAARNIGQELHAVQVERTRLQERVSALDARQEQLGQAIAETGERSQRASEEVEELRASQERIVRMLDEEQEQLQGLYQEAEQGEEHAAALDREAAAVRERLQGQVARLEEVEARVSGLGDRLGASRGREGELRAAYEGLLERTREELEVDLEALVQEQEQQGAGGQVAEAPSAASTGDEEAAPETSPQTEDWKAVEAEIRELREKVARLGNVNLAAVEELEEAEQRSGFLFREKGDLEKSQEQLRRVLKDIETRSTKLFMETFERVRENFADCFRRLFGGGKAEIQLADPESPLEAGIEIRARPPGKEPRSITLLSGGERTLTAVALLFAIFRANPAPCAFLDEVDAALDEDNTERFCSMLEDFLDMSQFVIVTHSRRTMERSDLLIGVTMPERGVSRPVTVELEQVAEDGRIHPLEHGTHAGETGAGEARGEEGAEGAHGAPDRRLEVAASAHRARPDVERRARSGPADSGAGPAGEAASGDAGG